MATITWRALTDSSWSGPSNWDTTSVPTASDYVRFTNLSVKNCTVDIDATMRDMTVYNTYTGSIIATGHTFKVSDNFKDDGNGGSRNYGNGITLSGNNVGDFSLHIGANLGDVTASSCAINIGTSLSGRYSVTYLDDDYGCIFRSLTGTTNTTISGAATTHLQGTGTLLNFTPGQYSVLSVNQDLYVEPTTSGTPVNAINGVNYFYGSKGIKIVTQNSGVKVSVPSIVPGALGYFHFTAAPGTDGTFVHTGVWGNSNGSTASGLYVYAQADSTVIYDTSSYGVNVWYVGYGSTDPSGYLKAYLRNSAIKTRWYDGTTYDSSSATINFGSSVFSNYNNLGTQSLWWYFGSNTDCSLGTSQITYGNYLSTGNLYLNSNGQSFMNISCNGNNYGGLVVQTNIVCLDLNCGGSTIVDMRNVSVESFGSVTLAGSFYRENSFLIMSGTSESLVIASNTSLAGNPTGTFVIRGSSITYNCQGDIKMDALYLESNSTLNINSSTNKDCTFSSATPLYMEQDVTLSFTSTAAFIQTDAGGGFGFPSSYTLGGNDIVYYILDTGTAYSASVPISYKTNNNLTSFFGGYSGDATWNLTSDLTSSSLGSSLGFVEIKTGKLTFNTNNYDLRVYNLYLGCANASGTFIANHGSSIIDTTNYRGDAFNRGTVYQYFSTSTWYARRDGLYQGYFYHGSNHVIDPGTSLVNIFYAYIVPMGKQFYDVYGSDINLANGDLTCNNFTCVGGCDLTLTVPNPQSNPHDIIASGDIRFTGNATHWMGADLHVTGPNGTIYLTNSSWYNSNTVNFIFTGSGDCTLTQGVSSYGYDFGKVYVGPGIRLTHTSGSSTYPFTYSGYPPLTIGADSTYTFNSARESYFYLSISGNMYSIDPSACFNGSGAPYFYTNGFSGAAYVPSLTYTGTGYITIGSYDLQRDVNFQQSGDLNTGSRPLVIYNNSNNTARIISYDTNGYDITCGDFIAGIVFDNVMTYYYGDSNLNIASYSHTYNYGAGGGIIINLEQSQWVCDGSWTYTHISAVNPGTSSVTFTDTARVTTDMAFSPLQGSFYDVTCNTTGKLVSLGVDTSCHDMLLIDGSYSQAGVRLLLSGDARFLSTGSLNLGNAIVSTGSDATVEIASTISSITSSNCDMTFSKPDTRLKVDQDATFKSLRLMGTAGTTIQGLGDIDLYLYTGTPLTIDSSTTLNIKSPLNVHRGTAGNWASLGSAYTIKGDSTLGFDSTTANATFTLPAINISESVITFIRNRSSGVSNTQQLAGAFTSTGPLILSNENTGTLTFRTQNYPISAGSLSWGSSHSSGTLTTDFSWGSISVGDVNPYLYNSGTNTVRFNRSRWSVSGDWVFPSTHNVTHAWDTVTFTGDSTVQSNGKYFNWVYLNSPNQLTLLDDLLCREFKNISGNLNLNGNDFKQAGYYCEIMITE